jgi:hypothetical protein
MFINGMRGIIQYYPPFINIKDQILTVKYYVNHNTHNCQILIL